MTDPKPPNLDLIRMVQQGRMLHDAGVKPSEVAAVYWLECKPSTAQTPTPRAGEWRIPTTLSAVDALWEAVKTATTEGKLGYKSKVSTAPAYEQAHTEARMIVVRTYDADDAADVARVETALRALGITDMQYVRIAE